MYNCITLCVCGGGGGGGRGKGGGLHFSPFFVVVCIFFPP